MAQILDPLPSNSSDRILCCYVNATNKVQVARISNIQNWYFERVVFPGQRLVFEAMPDALLEIHSGMMASAILSDTIPCARICIDDGGGDPPPAPGSQNNGSELSADANADNNQTLEKTVNIQETRDKNQKINSSLATASLAAVG